MIIDYVNTYRKLGTIEISNKVNRNIQGEVSPPQAIDANSSTPTVRKIQKQLNCPSPPATFLGNKDTRIETL